MTWYNDVFSALVVIIIFLIIYARLSNKTFKDIINDIKGLIKNE